ncbi:MAG: hypothetical protein JST39_03445 [Bacteroidetes bacterium]|nr:hypothetical protein [Bacteroidota bacterium]
MKQLLPFILLLALCNTTMAQTKKTTVFCSMSETGVLDFGHLRQELSGLLPDSIISQMTRIFWAKERRRNSMERLELMRLNGWKLESVNPVTNSAFGNASSFSYYLFSREITLTEQDHAVFVSRLMKDVDD